MINLTEETRQVLCAALGTAAEFEVKEIDRCVKAYGKTVNGEKLEELTARIDISNFRYRRYIDLLSQLKAE